MNKKYYIIYCISLFCVNTYAAETSQTIPATLAARCMQQQQGNVTPTETVTNQAAPLSNSSIYRLEEDQTPPATPINNNSFNRKSFESDKKTESYQGIKAAPSLATFAASQSADCFQKSFSTDTNKEAK